MLWQFLRRTVGLTSINQTKRMVINTLLFISILFIYSTLRLNKDTMVFDASPDLSGLVKTWMVLPGALLTGILLEYCFKRWGSKKVFYGTLVTFFTYMAAYVYIIGPYSKNFTLVENSFNALCWLLDAISSTVTFKFIYLGTILDNILGVVARNFSVSVYYVVSEIFGNVFIGMLFWGLINTTTAIEDATKTFTIYTGTASVASILAGYSNFIEIYPAIATNSTSKVVAVMKTVTTDSWDATLQSGFTKLAIAFIVTAAMYYLSRGNAEQDPDISFNEEKAFLKKKNKGKFNDGIKYLFNNKYIRSITITILCYSAIMFYLEYLYKGVSMELLGGDKLKFKAVQSLGMIALGISGLLTMVILIVTGNKLSWRNTLLTTPIVLLVTGGLFYLSAYGLMPLSIIRILGIQNLLSNRFYDIQVVKTIFAGAPLEYSIGVIVFGAIQGFMSKLAKYVFFDIAKEKAFLLATYEEKTIGKNAMESIVSRGGKAFSGLLLTTILVPLLRWSTGSTDKKSALIVLPYIGVLLAIILLVFFVEITKVVPMYERRLKIYNANNGTMPTNITDLPDENDDDVPSANESKLVNSTEEKELDETLIRPSDYIHYPDEEEEELSLEAYDDEDDEVLELDDDEDDNTSHYSDEDEDF